MIDQGIFQRIAHVVNEHEGRVTQLEVLQALNEELGEYAKALRVEAKTFMSRKKVVTESSKVEIIDLMLVSIEAYIRSGGTWDEMLGIAERKLTKWEGIMNEGDILS